jgi:hypothetical protein
MVMGDVTNASYRVAAHTVTKAVRATLVGAIKATGSESGLADIAKEVLSTDEGKAIVGLACGYAGTYLPGPLGDNPHMQKISEELRVESMVEGANLTLERIGEEIMPELVDMISKLPLGQEIVKKARVAHHEDEDDFEDDFASKSRKA